MLRGLIITENMKTFGKKSTTDKPSKRPRNFIKHSTNPSISVICPVFNGQKTIAGTINSILNQTYNDWELIIINDGSTDETTKEIEKFSDKRIKVFSQEHKGIVAARNLGNKKALGEICIVQDADDYSLPDRLEKVIKVFEKKNPDVLLHSAYVNGWNSQYGCVERKYLKAVYPSDRLLISQNLPGWPAYKRAVWQARPFREETRFAYDWMMHLDWYLTGFRYAVLDEALYEYVRYQGSASDRFERDGTRQKAFETIKQILKDEYGIKT